MSDAKGFPLPQTGGSGRCQIVKGKRRERVKLAGSWEVGRRSYVATARLLTPSGGLASSFSWEVR